MPDSDRFPCRGTGRAAWVTRVGRAIIGLAAVLIVALGTGSAAAAGEAELGRVLPTLPLEPMFPGGGVAVGAVTGDPPAAPVLRDGRPIGLILLTSDVVASAGYARKPVKIAVGLDLTGHITGATVVEHHEPILVLGIGPSRLDAFLEQYRGLDIRQPVRVVAANAPDVADALTVHMVSRASITSLVFHDSILRAARQVARAHGLIGADGSAGGIDLETFHAADWKTLLANGSVRHLRVTDRDLAERLGELSTGGGEAPSDSEPVVLDLFLALATPAAIGQNLFGFQAHAALLTDLPAGSQVVMVAGGGAYSYKGYAFRKTGVFDRLQLVQGEQTVRLQRDMYRSVETFALADAPEVRDISLFVLGPDSGFDPLQPWRLEILVERPGPDGRMRSVVIPFDYRIPPALIRAAPVAEDAADVPVWRQRWADEAVSIGIVGATLATLLAILFFHDRLARHPQTMRWLRPTFLVFTLVYLGWGVDAQLSVLNVIALLHAVRDGFSWDFFLIEPIIFILWCFVAVTILLWGRGVFCGWLCPFGALQELLNRVAVALGVPQVSIPYHVHERLSSIKYIIFIALVAVSLGLPVAIESVAEVEPFKTVIALRMLRAGHIVLYALALLGLALVLPRPFCRYLCPLGAALAIASRNPMFDWLHRRRQCGTECQICASRCPVQAVSSAGLVRQHECIYCLGCQQIYYDDSRCPSMIARRKRREQGDRLREKMP